MMVAQRSRGFSIIFLPKGRGARGKSRLFATGFGLLERCGATRGRRPAATEVGLQPRRYSCVRNLLLITQWYWITGILVANLRYSRKGDWEESRR